MFGASIVLLTIYTHVSQLLIWETKAANLCEGKHQCGIIESADLATSMLQIPTIGEWRSEQLRTVARAAQQHQYRLQRYGGTEFMYSAAASHGPTDGTGAAKVSGVSNLNDDTPTDTGEKDADAIIESSNTTHAQSQASTKTGTVANLPNMSTQISAASVFQSSHASGSKGGTTSKHTVENTPVPTYPSCSFSTAGMRRLIVDLSQQQWCFHLNALGETECNRSYVACEAEGLTCISGTIKRCEWNTGSNRCARREPPCIEGPSPSPTVAPTPAPTPIHDWYQRFPDSYCQPWTQNGGNATATTVEECLWLCLADEDCVAVSWFPSYSLRCYLFSICPASNLGDSIVYGETYIRLNQALFTFDSTPRNYAQSASYCRSHGRVIASIQNAEEVNQLAALVTSSAYLGATIDSKGNWSWVDGSPWGYPPFDESLAVDGTRLVINADGSTAFTAGENLFGVVCRFVVVDLHYCGWPSSTSGGLGASCGLQGADGSGCTSSVCEKMADCISQCNACASCKGFSYKPNGGQYRCWMQQGWTLPLSGSFVEEQPNTAEWWPYINERDSTCTAPPTPTPGTPSPTDIQQVYATNHTWLGLSIPRSDGDLDPTWSSVLAGDMTWEGWFRVTSPPAHRTTLIGSAEYEIDVRGGDYSRGGHRRRHGSVFIAANGEIYLNTNAGKTASQWATRGMDGSSTQGLQVADVLWHHIAIVWNRTGEQGHLYLDAKIVGHVEYEFSGIPNDIVAIDGRILVGGGLCESADPGGSCLVRRTLECEISQLRIWTRSFTVRELRTCAFKAPEQNLFALYPLVDDLRDRANRNAATLAQIGTGGRFVPGHAVEDCVTPVPTPAPTTGPPGCIRDTGGECDENQPCFTMRGNTTCIDGHCICTNYPHECAVPGGVFPFFLARVCKSANHTWGYDLKAAAHDVFGASLSPFLGL